MAIDRSLLFTIVMPAFNVDAYIEDAIHDVLEQSWSNWNLIIVDDCSTDQTGMLADAYADADTRIRAMHQDRRQGLAAARNTGLSAAEGDYVLFLNPEDRYDLEMLATIADALHRLPADMIAWSLERDYYTPRGRIEWNEVQYLDTAFYDCRNSQKEEQFDGTINHTISDALEETESEHVGAEEISAQEDDQKIVKSQSRQRDSTQPRRQMKKAQIDALGLDARHNLEIGHCTGFMTDVFDMQDAVDDLSEQSLLALLSNKAYRRAFLMDNPMNADVKNAEKTGADSPVQSGEKNAKESAAEISVKSGKEKSSEINKIKPIKFSEDNPSEDVAFNMAVTEKMTSLVTLEDVLCGISIRRQKGFGNFLKVQKMKIHDLKTGSGLGVN